MHGSPVERSAFPGLALEPTGMIYLRGKKPVYKAIADTSTMVLDPDKLVELLTTKEASTVVADIVTFGKLLVMADNLPSVDNKSLARRLRIAEGLPGSVKLPILTRALAYRYWLPEGLDDQSFQEWADAFDVVGPTTAITMRALMDRARTSTHKSSKFKEDAFRLEDLEFRLHESAAYGGKTTDNNIYTMLDKYGAVSGGLRSIDPGLLDMHVLDGTVCRITPQNTMYKSFTTTVSTPFKFKEGAKIRLTDGVDVVESSLVKLRFVSNQLVAEFSNPPARGAGALMVSRAKEGKAPLYITDSVFAPFTTGPKNKRWTAGPVEPVTGRTVPMDVVIAGAPVAK